jgi:CubicO group peptidase (beta-lactamase class C family)
MVAMLAHDGKIDLSKRIDHYLPELKGSGFADATVQQLMDMTVAIEFNEDYADPNADIFKFAYAGGFFPAAPDYSGPLNFYDYLKTVKKNGEHGQYFNYQSVDTEVLGWLIKKVTGAPAETYFSERIWSKLGTEHDAYILVDSTGVGFAAGGLNTTLRDHARFAEMIRKDGRFNGQQIVPKSIIDDIRKGASQEHFEYAKYHSKKGYSYHNQWWISHNENGAFTASGIHGQTYYIDPAAQMVIVRFASHPVATNRVIDATSLPAYQAVADYLTGK